MYFNELDDDMIDDDTDAAKSLAPNLLEVKHYENSAKSVKSVNFFSLFFFVVIFCLCVYILIIDVRAHVCMGVYVSTCVCRYTCVHTLSCGVHAPCIYLTVRVDDTKGWA